MNVNVENNTSWVHLINRFTICLNNFYVLNTKIKNIVNRKHSCSSSTYVKVYETTQ